ncbi:GDSL-type esterase/lipase family protein [Kitasatospora sp. NBC_00315]|uniref:GDSL-type esterase/lipase family protein n=1 Tax=Kitasatospora sp. NBC_00315 TaxID=2975963 RepID=UPI003244AF04
MTTHLTSAITTAITTEGPVAVRGALDLERTPDGLQPHRLPPAARAQFPDEYIGMVEAQPCGVRLAFRTASATVELEARPTRIVWSDGSRGPDGVYDLLVDGRPVRRAGVVGGGDVMAVDADGRTRTTPGPAGRARFTGLGEAMKDVEIWLPHAERTELIALHTDAPVHSPAPAAGPVWLHHGSSISHCTEADGPTDTWPAVAAARTGVQLVNLGLGGNALLDPFTARAIRDTPADLISLKLGINLVNTDAFRLRAFGPAVHGFLDTVRDGHPDTPLLVVSPILCPAVEDSPGPTVADPDSPTLRFVTLGTPADLATGRLSLNVIRRELSAIVASRARHDRHLHYLDGRELYGLRDFAELPLPDGLHPDTAGYRLMGERFASLAFGPGRAFARTPAPAR